LSPPLPRSNSATAVNTVAEIAIGAASFLNIMDAKREVRIIMCDQCSGFSERMRLNTPREYLDLVQQLETLVASSVLRLVHGTAPLADLFKDQQWPGDSMTHVFECLNCKQRFKLSAETYHGSGAVWEMMTKEERSAVQ
jgi:hypothetical protein